jgi:coatomer subunit beta'
MSQIWHSTTYRLENTLNYGMERVWSISYIKGSNSYVGWSEQDLLHLVDAYCVAHSTCAGSAVIFAVLLQHGMGREGGMLEMGESEGQGINVWEHEVAFAFNLLSALGFV